MSMILQGTTPSLEIIIDPDDFLVTDVQKLEILIWQDAGKKSTYNLTNTLIDDEANSFTVEFSEAYTMSLRPASPLYWQMRCMLPNGNIVGTPKSRGISIGELMSKELLSG